MNHAPILSQPMPDRTEAQAREAIARKDRQGWYSRDRYVFRKVSSGGLPVVCNCEPRDAEMIATMAQSWDALVAALEIVQAYLDVSLGSPSWQGENPYPVMAAALALARGVPVLKTADETASQPGAIR